MSDFHDHFSGHAATYAAHRPVYPDALFGWLASLPAERLHAWDCATGNGQAACALARHFARVTATDASAQQIGHAMAAPGVNYQVASAEHSGLSDCSVDLITVAQAAHWFDMAAFSTEVERVLKPGGVLALWTYRLIHVTPDVDAVIHPFYHDTLGPYWPAERRHVDNGYQDLALPFTPVPAPAFRMQAERTLAGLVGYLTSWSATQRWQRATGQSLEQVIGPALAEAWGDAPTRSVDWPLAVRCTRR